MNKIKRIIDRASDYNRERKYRLFLKIFQPDKNSKILDVGAAEKEWRDTSNLLEKRYLYPENITALGVDNFEQFNARYPKVKIVKYGGGPFPFKDNSFDFCWCNAVIEHVGDRDQQAKFLKEISRVAKRAFVTTPNRYFILESHSRVILLHYLPRDLFNRILKITGNSYPGHLIHLLGFNDIIRLLRECKLKDYEIIRNKLLGLTIDFVIKF